MHDRPNVQIVGYTNMINLFFPYLPEGKDRLPEASDVTDINVWIKLLSFLMPFISLRMLLAATWDNTLLARVYEVLSSIGHSSATKKVVSDKEAELAHHDNHSHHVKGSMRVSCEHAVLAVLPWCYVVGMWFFACFIVFSITSPLYCENFRVCQGSCFPSAAIAESNPELLNAPLKAGDPFFNAKGTSGKHCLLGPYRGILSYIYDNEALGTARKLIEKDLPVAVEIYSDKHRIVHTRQYTAGKSASAAYSEKYNGITHSNGTFVAYGLRAKVSIDERRERVERDTERETETHREKQRERRQRERVSKRCTEPCVKAAFTLSLHSYVARRYYSESTTNVSLTRILTV